MGTPYQYQSWWTDGSRGRGLCRPFDHASHVIRLGDIHRVAGLDFRHFGAGPFVHRALEVRVYHPVLRRDDAVAGLRLPGWRGDRRTQGATVDRYLRDRHELRLSGRQVGRKIRRELRLIDQQIAVRGWRDAVRCGSDAAQERADLLALVRCEGGDIDQARDMRVVAGLGDDSAAIAVADEHGRTGLAVEDAVGGGNVIRQRSSGSWTMLTV